MLAPIVWGKRSATADRRGSARVDVRLVGCRGARRRRLARALQRVSVRHAWPALRSRARWLRSEIRPWATPCGSARSRSAPRQRRPKRALRERDPTIALARTTTRSTSPSQHATQSAPDARRRARRCRPRARVAAPRSAKAMARRRRRLQRRTAGRLVAGIAGSGRVPCAANALRAVRGTLAERCRSRAMPAPSSNAPDTLSSVSLPARVPDQRANADAPDAPATSAAGAGKEAPTPSAVPTPSAAATLA